MKLRPIFVATLPYVAGVVCCSAVTAGTEATSPGTIARPSAIAQADVLQEVYARLKELERQNFGTEYEMDLLTQRLDRLEKKVFGSTQSGNPKARLDRLLLTAGESPSKSEPADTKKSEVNSQTPTPGPRIYSDGGMTIGRRKVDYGPYEADLSRRIRRAWFPPKDAGSKHVELTFKIARDGTMGEYRTDIASDDQAYENSACKAIENAAPYAVLPAGSPEQVDVLCSFTGTDVSASVQVAGKTRTATNSDSISARDFVRKEVEGTDFTSYFESAAARIKPHWNPTETPGKPAVIGLTIKKTGEIEDVELLEQSGNSQFDSSTKKALEAAKNLGAIPAPVKEELWSWIVFDGKEVVVAVPPEINFGPYMSALQKKIREAWIPPKSHRSKRVTIQFKVARAGEMTAIKITGPSGTAAADGAALKAARSANPLERLPRGSPPNVDVEFTFDYNVIHGDNAPSAAATDDESEGE